MKISFLRLVTAALLATCLCLSCSMFYPRAKLVRESAPEGVKALRIVYPTPKLVSYATACTMDRCAVFFQILDYVTTSFPPPYGETLDERWLSYLGITDRKFNPLPGKLIFFDNRAQIKRTFSGPECALGTFEREFVAVYLAGSEFYYSVFDTNGTELVKKQRIYGNKRDADSANRVMSYGFHNRCIYLFLVEAPESMYAGSWSLNVVRHEIDSQETQIMKNFIPRKEGFYHSARMSTHFKGDTLYMAWVDGTKVSGKDAGMYTLTPSFSFASCAVGARQAVALDIPLEGVRGSFNDADVAFIEKERELVLAIHDGNAVWTQAVGEGGGLVGRAKRSSDPSLKALFDPGWGDAVHRLRIFIGPE